MNKKRTFKTLFPFFLVLCAIFLMSMPASAASAKKNCWYEKNGRYYYYDSKGNLAKGTKKINGKYYYFNSNGRQRNGWVLSGKRYYFFKNSPGRGGYRLASTKVNGVQLQANGVAVVTNDNKTKLDLLKTANIIAYKVSNLNMSKEDRLRRCFNYMVNDLRYRNIHSFRLSNRWGEYYASYALKQGYGDCYCGGAGFAYLAAAVGYNNVYAVSSGGHGWCEIDGKVYDPNWARMTGRGNRYFGFTKSMLTGSDPNYFRYGIYRFRVDVY